MSFVQKYLELENLDYKNDYFIQKYLEHRKFKLKQQFLFEKHTENHKYNLQKYVTELFYSTITMNSINVTCNTCNRDILFNNHNEHHNFNLQKWFFLSKSTPVNQASDLSGHDSNKMLLFVKPEKFLFAGIVQIQGVKKLVYHFAFKRKKRKIFLRVQINDVPG
jgi:hypothetical protein